MKKTLNYVTKMVVIIGMLITGMLFMPQQTAFAASPVKVMAVVYSDDCVYVFNNGNSRIYYATETDAAKDNWEVVEAEEGKFTMLDMSWLSANIENIIKIKGEEDSTQTRVIFYEKPRKLEVSISYGKINELASAETIAPLVNIMASEGTGINPIGFTDLQWKKGDGGQWRSTDSLTVGLLEKFLVRGAYLYFRIKPLNDVVDAKEGTTIVDISGVFDYNESNLIDSSLDGPAGNPLSYGIDFPDGTDGRRASSEIKVKIIKKSSPMVIGVDGEDFAVEMKYGKEYRVTTKVGSTETTTGWLQITDRATKILPLATIINDGSEGMTNPFPAMIIEIRDYATTKTASSKITEITLEAQRVLTGSIIQGKAPITATATDKSIYISYNGIKNMVITIPSASVDNPYEYCVVKPDDVFSLTRAVWTSISKSTEVKILASKAVDGGTIYIRQREIDSKEATATKAAVTYALASTYVTQSISYPSVPTITKTSYTFTKGYPQTISFDITLNVVGKKPFETAIKSIKLGTKEIAFTPSVTPTIGGLIDASKVYTMTVTLNEASLQAMANCYTRAIQITYANGTTDKVSIRLTIQNPTVATSLTATAAKGKTAATTAVTVVSSVGIGNSFVYLISDTAITSKYIQDTVTSGIAFTSGSDITIAAGKYLTIYEINTTTQHIVKYKCIQITADNIYIP